MRVTGVNKVTLVSCKKEKKGGKKREKKLSLNIDASPIIGSFWPHYGGGFDSASNTQEYQE